MTSTLADLSYECPICLNKILPPVFQCHNGHLICSTCIPPITTCPICREPMPKKKRIRSIEIEKIIQLQDHECPFSHLGCKAVMKYEEINDHKFDCQYASLPFCTVLGLTGCKKEIPVSDFQRHVLEDHGKRIHIPNAEFGTSYFFRGQLKPQAERNQRTLYKFFNICFHKDKPRQIYFILRITHKKEQIIFSVFYLGGKKTAEKYTYEIGITDLNDDPRLICKGSVFSLQTEAEDLEASFTAPVGYLRSLRVTINGEDNYRGCIKIQRKPEPVP